MSQIDATLAELRWQRRVLIVQTDAGAAGALRAQLGSASRALAERDLQVFLPPEPLSHDGAVRLSDIDALAARLGLDGSGSVQTVLLGKDGGVKLRQTGPLDLGEIFTTIDAMPMRQREMRERR